MKKRSYVGIIVISVLMVFAYFYFSTLMLKILPENDSFQFSIVFLFLVISALTSMAALVVNFEVVIKQRNFENEKNKPFLILNEENFPIELESIDYSDKDKYLDEQVNIHFFNLHENTGFNLEVYSLEDERFIKRKKNKDPIISTLLKDEEYKLVLNFRFNKEDNTYYKGYILVFSDQYKKVFYEFLEIETRISTEEEKIESIPKIFSQGTYQYNQIINKGIEKQILKKYKTKVKNKKLRAEYSIIDNNR